MHGIYNYNIIYMININDNGISILVLSCDKYQPYWDAFYSLLFRYWKDYPFKIFHCSENEIYQNKRIVSISTHLSKDPSYWSEGLKLALKKIDSDHIILFLEDFFLLKQVNDDILCKCISVFLNDHDLKYLRFLPVPSPDTDYDKSELIGLQENEQYRISTQLAIWDKEYLTKLVRNGESPWEFESNASKRSLELQGLIGVVNNMKEYPITYINAVIQNKITRKAFKFCEKEKIFLDKNKISLNSRIEELYWNCKSIFIRKSVDFIHHRIFPIKKIF